MGNTGKVRPNQGKTVQPRFRLTIGTKQFLLAAEVYSFFYQFYFARKNPKKFSDKVCTEPGFYNDFIRHLGGEPTDVRLTLKVKDIIQGYENAHAKKSKMIRLTAFGDAKAAKATWAARKILGRPRTRPPRKPKTWSPKHG